MFVFAFPSKYWHRKSNPWRLLEVIRDSWLAWLFSALERLFQRQLRLMSSSMWRCYAQTHQCRPLFKRGVFQYCQGQLAAIPQQVLTSVKLSIKEVTAWSCPLSNKEAWYKHGLILHHVDRKVVREKQPKQPNSYPFARNINKRVKVQESLYSNRKRRTLKLSTWQWAAMIVGGYLRLTRLAGLKFRHFL